MSSHTAIPVIWLDGVSAQAQEAFFQVEHDRAEVFVNESGIQEESEPVVSQRTVASAPVSSINVSSALGNVPTRIEFADGAVAVTLDRSAVERLIPAAQRRNVLNRLERSAPLVALALFGLLAAMWWLHKTAIPVIAEFAAHRVPRTAELNLGEAAERTIRKSFLKPSKLSSEQKKSATETFNRLAAAAGLTDKVTLGFGNAAPNALALPGGKVFLTDSLVKLVKYDQNLLAGVLAHELGHVHHRHSLRALLQASASGLLLSTLAGDASGMSAMAVTIPLVFGTVQYTRAGEYEADQYAVDLMRKAGLKPAYFGDAMQRFEDMTVCIELKRRDREKWHNDNGHDEEVDDVNLPPELQRDEAEHDMESTHPRRKKPSTETIAKASCYEFPEKIMAGREAEVKEILQEESETGYLHTHPATRERVERARAQK